MKRCVMGDFSETKFPKTNEEYKEYLKRKDRKLWWVMLAGALLAALGVFGEYCMKTAIDDYMLGVYCGLGVGMVAVGIAQLIRHKQLMKNEEKIKKARLEMGDERLQEIGKKAFRTAAWVMIIAMYAVSLVGGLFYPVLPKILLCMVCVFLLAYSVSYRIIEKRL